MTDGYEFEFVSKKPVMGEFRCIFGDATMVKFNFGKYT